MEISSFVVIYSLPQFFLKLLVQLMTLHICSFLETTNISVYNKSTLCEITKSLRILRCILMDQNVIKLMFFCCFIEAILEGIEVMVFPVVMYGCESWTVKKAEHRRIDAFELWC